MYVRIRVGQPARNPVRGERVGEIRERRRVRIARLFLHYRVVDRPAIHARRRTGFQAPGFEAETFGRSRQSDRGSLAHPSAAVAALADVDDAVHERATRKDDGRRVEHLISLRPNARYTSTFRSEEHTSELQSRGHLGGRLLLDKTNHTR